MGKYVPLKFLFNEELAEKWLILFVNTILLSLKETLYLP